MPALKISQIERSGGTQIRSQYDDAAIQRYSDAWMSGIELPDVDVFFDGTKHYLADGFHRAESKWLANLPVAQHLREINCRVHMGTQRDAIKFALSANSDHGLPRTGEDIRRAIARCLDDVEWSELSNVAIAKMCVCSESMVRKVKGERTPAIEEADSVVESSEDIPVIENRTARDPIVRSRMAADALGDAPPYPIKQFEPTVANPETAQIGEVLATAIESNLLINKNWDAVPDLAEPLFEVPSANEDEIAPCEFKEGDRVVDAADNRAGNVIKVFRQGAGWYLDVELDSGHYQKGAAEMYHPEPQRKQSLLYVYILVKPELGDLVATHTKAKGYQYHKLQEAIGQNNLVMSGVRSVIQSIADKEGGVVKKMIVTVED